MDRHEYIVDIDDEDEDESEEERLAEFRMSFAEYIREFYEFADNEFFYEFAK